jgi:hypothetical protein
MSAWKRRQAASVGQLFREQLKIVQYPFGWDVSHNRSPLMEQSVDKTHLSPIDGVHAASPNRRERTPTHPAK